VKARPDARSGGARLAAAEAAAAVGGETEARRQKTEKMRPQGRRSAEAAPQPKLMQSRGRGHAAPATIGMKLPIMGLRGNLP